MKKYRILKDILVDQIINFDVKRWPKSRVLNLVLNTLLNRVLY